MPRLLLLFLVISLGFPLVTTAGGSASIDGRLSYLQTIRGQKDQSFAGSVRFIQKPGPADFSQLESLGVQFLDHGRGPVGSRTVFPAHIPFPVLEQLKNLDILAAIDCAWRPRPHPALFRSRPQVEADLAWEVPSPLGGTLTGRGVTLADYDTGVNYLHSNFFKLSGETFEWLDLNLNGEPDQGDAVDFNGNGAWDPGEDLLYHEVQNTHIYGNDPDSYNLGFDFLFNDANSNGYRDGGPPEFGEDDPTYGERLFLPSDLKSNGDDLLALGESRIKAILNTDGSVHRRGVDLLTSEMDDWGHGTQVTGIMGGGWPQWSRMAGMAPGAEFIHMNQAVEDYETPLEGGLAWAVAEGADIVIFEFGTWVWEYLDGSSNLEIMINEFAEDPGTIMVLPAGNLSGGHLHCRFNSSQVQVLDNTEFYTTLWLSFLWTDPVDLGLTITVPWGTPTELPLDGTTIVHQEYEIYSNLSTSPRGTRRLDLRLSGYPEELGVGQPWVFNFSGPPVDIHGYFDDSVRNWTSAGTWQTGEHFSHTVTWPATADSGLVVGAYSTPDDGDILWYSGWGPRIDGYPLLDLAGPGNSVYAPSPWSSLNFTEFGGTSCSAPHVAGAAALLKELLPGLDNARCQQILRAGTAVDQYTIDSHRWGAGKLRIQAAIAHLLTHVSEQPPSSDLSLSAFPNPFNPAITLRFHLPEAGSAEVRIFDLQGREVWSAVLAAGPPGWREVSWLGLDHQDRRSASGVYFAHVKQGPSVSVCKVSLIK